MFDWFKSKKDMDKKDDNVIKFPEPKSYPAVPPVKPVAPVQKPKPKPEPKEHYRVGRRDDNMTTLTVMGNDSFSITLAMNEEACEQLIKVLRATYE